MHAKIIIYHNPHCTKSRQTLQLLHGKGLTPEVIEYLKTPPSTAQIKHILSLLGMTPRDLMRKNELQYKDLNLGNAALNEDALITAMHQHPALIERPIVLAHGRAAVGRPPENVLEIL
jgi:arsenate reductase (glutaredoxin)